MPNTSNNEELLPLIHGREVRLVQAADAFCNFVCGVAKLYPWWRKHNIYFIPVRPFAGKYIK
jgi:hypothetical protein